MADKDLTKYQRRFVEAIVEQLANGEKRNVNNALLAAGYSKGSLKSAGGQLMANENVQATILEKVVEIGLKQGKDPTLVEKLNDDWVIRGMRALAVKAKSEAVRGNMYVAIGKYRKLAMWTERYEQVDVPESREKLIERINQFNAKHIGAGLSAVGGTTGTVPSASGTADAGGQEPAGQPEVNSDAAGFSVGSLRDQVVQRGERKREVSDTGDRCDTPDAGGTPSTDNGGDSEAPDICEGDVADTG